MASKRVVQRRLYFFLRLCDYIIFNTLHSMVVESVSDLLGHLQIQPSIPPPGLLSTPCAVSDAQN